MLPSLSGSEVFARSFRFSITESTEVGQARRAAAQLCDAMGFDETHKGRVGIVINEMGSNLVRHAGGGEIVLQASRADETCSLEVLALDKGPGMSNTAACLRDGFSTGSTPGTGLGAIRRQADVFDLYSLPGKGTAVLAIVCSKAATPYSIPLGRRFVTGAVCLPIKGENVCGDAWTASRSPEGKISILVADGLGHGPLAHKAAIEATNTFGENPHRPVEELMSRIHGRLRSTRGAAVSVIEIDLQGGEARFAGVGNVRGAMVEENRTKTLLSHNGTLGLQFRVAKPQTVRLENANLFVLHSDGLTSRWDLSHYPGLTTRHPSLIAGVLCRDFTRGTDDVTVVVGGWIQ